MARYLLLLHEAPGQYAALTPAQIVAFVLAVFVSLSIELLKVWATCRH